MIVKINDMASSMRREHADTSLAMKPGSGPQEVMMEFSVYEMMMWSIFFTLWREIISCECICVIGVLFFCIMHSVGANAKVIMGGGRWD